MKEDISPTDLAHYEATINAWITTRLDRDRHLMSLSAGGIGLLVTLFTAFPDAVSQVMCILLPAIVAFLFTIGAVLQTTYTNADYLRGIAKKKLGQDTQEEIDKGGERLKLLGYATVVSFGFGVVLTVIGSLLVVYV